MNDQVNLLVVDDDPFIAEMIGMILEDEGFGVITAENGREAWDVILARPREIALIVTDMNMPEIGGLELLDRLRASGSNLPVIVLSGGSESTDQTEALRRGATATLVKDEDIQEKILDSVRGILPGFCGVA